MREWKVLVSTLETQVVRWARSSLPNFLDASADDSYPISALSSGRQFTRLATRFPPHPSTQLRLCLLVRPGRQPPFSFPSRATDHGTKADYGYTTNYSNGAGGDGGGFMPGSQTDSPSAKRSYGKDTLRPVTIKQLLDAQQPHPDAEYFTISGADTTQVTFIGQIRNISTQTTNITYKLDDGTGLIEVKLWTDSDAMNDDSTEDDARGPRLTEQAYARVWGRIKVFGSKRHIACNIIRPIQDFNEIQYHLLEATAVHLHFSRGPPEALQQGKGGAGGQQQQQQGQNGGYGMADGLSHASARARKVFECIKDTPQTNEGLHAQDIAARIGMDMSEVLKAGEELTGMGKVYTTIDDLTWAILDV
nr:replication factor a protein 2 [Quercus suber]